MVDIVDIALRDFLCCHDSWAKEAIDLNITHEYDYVLHDSRKEISMILSLVSCWAHHNRMVMKKKTC